ncbi:hypothetical protein [Skermanella pratensis]|uniref:hypothetical protein n=1 Tax=Skermanella pratensis TaxID=2233999 RepID=UPI0013014902|nr:hypothetical protein [Skermanella pratensis]
MAIPTFVVLLVFVVVHVFVGRLRFLYGVPRSRRHSNADRVAVAYVFLHVLPEPDAHQQTFGTRSLDAEVPFLEFEIHLVTLAGLIAFLSGGVLPTVAA